MDGISPALVGYACDLGEALGPAQRRELAALAPLLEGTAADGLEETRGYLALDWLVRRCLPAWLRLVPEMGGYSDLLAGHTSIRTPETADAAAQTVLHIAAGCTVPPQQNPRLPPRLPTGLAQIALGPGLLEEVWTAARLTWDPARWFWSASREALRPESPDGWHAGWDAARETVRAAALQAAGSAVEGVAWNLTGAARAKRRIAQELLTPITDALHADAIALYRRMLEHGGSSANDN